MQALELPTAAATRAFYEARFARGYMDRWEADRHARLCDVLAGIELPPRARVLDFGCGSGSLTRLLRQRWPEAELHGADISRTAVQHAQERLADSGATFHELDETFVRDHAGRFDFVFSHHVLEHVFDLGATVAELVALLAPGGRMLHALPCGNPGSLPHRLAAGRRGGIDPVRGNRFFFEDPSHVRRLTTDELAAAFAPHGVRVVRAHYGYHHWGAVRLFTEMQPAELFAVVDPRRCGRRDWPLAGLCVALAALRAPAQVLLRTRRLLQQVFAYRTRRLAEPASLCLCALAVPALLLAPLSALVEAAVAAFDRREWRTRRGDARGSEMMVEFVRDAAAPAAPRAPQRDCVEV